MQEEREERERDRERYQEKEKERREEREEWKKVSEKIQYELNSKKILNESISTQPIATCLECNSLKSQVVMIDEKINRFSIKLLYFSFIKFIYLFYYIIDYLIQLKHLMME